MNELFEEMTNDYKIFCRSARRFIDACKEQQIIQKKPYPDYRFWIGKLVRVWNENDTAKQKAILLDYIPNMEYPFVVAGCWFKHAELCEKQNL